MDQIKIGKFIAEVRKKQGMTQKKLADSLGISDKTVSKWECGKGMPDYALMLPLCSTLNITVNELLSGETLSDVDYSEKAEENFVTLIQESAESRKKNRRNTVRSILCGIPLIYFLFLVFQFYLNLKGIWANFMNPLSLVIVLAIIMLELLFTKSAVPFFKSFLIVLKKQEVAKEELNRSLQAVRLAYSTTKIAGVLCAIISLVAVLTDLTLSELGPKLALAFLSIFNSILILLILLPFKNKLESMQ
ncbi:MAG: helix-turn-helix transcriptional regulator [Eubacterium sp.]|jgi:Predicted transcription factor, homolog of eukaryotic MBF1|nr:helix-turn-helix transcriptional regulator [Eubacterium sp.]